jgi:hypothetical protein
MAVADMDVHAYFWGSDFSHRRHPLHEASWLGAAAHASEIAVKFAASAAAAARAQFGLRQGAASRDAINLPRAHSQHVGELRALDGREGFLSVSLLRFLP